MTAYASEIDDATAAVREILGQIDIEGGLLENSVGIISCYADFVESGAVRAICEALPFEVVGSTTLASAVDGGSGFMQLALIVLTGDDVSFTVGMTSPLSSEDEAPLREAYESALSRAGRKPSLMLSFAPMLMNISGDFYVNAFNKISEGVPNFGTVSVDHNLDYHEAQIICNGEAYPDRYAFIMVCGDIAPKFITGSISPGNIFSVKGVVTASRGNHLQSVNGTPVFDYLQTIGLKKDENGMIVGINSFPFIVDFNDGTTPVVRAIFAQTPEGYGVCGGDIPVGATLTVGTLDADEVLRTAETAVASAAALENPACILMFSCIGRHFSLGYNPMSEIEKIQGLMEGRKIPYHFAYSGGEFCPVYSRASEDKSTTNRNHSDTLVICVL
ncbi:MAG: FIST C-terminal domain-containing protein [Synergistaceae bacterium]|jgi:hypothetical protein|nr:FIST C-terminal domain-containing protein [Synergistaceae bacterium]